MIVINCSTSVQAICGIILISSKIASMEEVSYTVRMLNKKSLVIFLALLGFSTVSFASAAVCPFGKGESTLSFTRVMYNLGKYTRVADLLSNIGGGVGSGNAAAVDEAQLEAALLDLPVAVACADAVIDDTTNILLPSTALDLDAESLNLYSQELKKGMVQFKYLLEKYYLEIQTQKTKLEGDRNFSVSYGISREIKDFVADMHEELTVESVSADVLFDRKNKQRALVPLVGQMHSVVFYKDDFNISRTQLYKYCWVVFPQVQGQKQVSVVSYCTNHEPTEFHVPKILDVFMSSGSFF